MGASPAPGYTEHGIMNKLLGLLLVGALSAGLSTPAASETLVVVSEQGKPVASFNIGDSRCVLKDDQIACTPVRP